MAAEAAASKVPSSERMRRSNRDDVCARRGMAAPAP
jgi:hypothetical protein